MNKLIYIFTILLFTTTIYGQTEERFTVKGSAKLITTWPNKYLNEALGTLTSGDNILITTLQNNIYVTVIHNKIRKQLVLTGGEADVESTIIKVYEYDFDNDGQKEIIVIHSPESSIAIVEVFRYSNGLAERIGNFNGQFDIELDKSIIYLPYGSQGLGDEYLYKDGVFYELIYHDPDKVEE